MGKKKNKGKNKMEEVLNEEVLNKEDEASEADGTNEEAKDAVEETAETEASVETGEEAGEDATEESDPKQSRIEELEDKVKRQLAEFDNFRKRTDKEKETMFEAGAKSVIEKLLPSLIILKEVLHPFPKRNREAHMRKA